MLRQIATAFVLAACLAIAVVAGLPAVAQAKDPFEDACTTTQGSGDSTVCRSRNQTTNPLIGSSGVLNRIIDFMSIVGGIMVTIVVVIGGFKYITSDGDSSKISSAKNTIIYGLIGLAVIVLARIIVSVVVSRIS
jgi:hypothetical protein